MHQAEACVHGISIEEEKKHGFMQLPWLTRSYDVGRPGKQIVVSHHVGVKKRRPPRICCRRGGQVRFSFSYALRMHRFHSIQDWDEEPESGVGEWQIWQKGLQMLRQELLDVAPCSDQLTL